MDKLLEQLNTVDDAEINTLRVMQILLEMSKDGRNYTRKQRGYFKTAADNVGRALGTIENIDIGPPEEDTWTTVNS